MSRKKPSWKEWIPRIAIDEKERKTVEKIDQVVRFIFRTAEYLIVAGTLTYINQKIDNVYVAFLAYATLFGFAFHVAGATQIVSIAIFPRKYRFSSIANTAISIILAGVITIISYGVLIKTVDDVAKHLSR